MENATQNLPPLSLKDWLVRAYEMRLARNPQYTLRAYARDLELDPSQLSYILKGKKGLSYERAQQVAKKLGYSVSESQLFLLTVKQERSRSAIDRNQAKIEIQKIAPQEKSEFFTLTFDTYRLISDWHNTAILEYLRRPRANQTPGTIAKQFNLSVIQVEETLSRLERLGWIKKNTTRYQVTTGPIASPTGVPSEALRSHHTQTLKKAEQALHFQGLDEREFSSTQLVIRKEKIPEIKNFLKSNWKTFCERFVDNETGDAVYEYAYQLFELGKIETKSTQTPKKRSHS